MSDSRPRINIVILAAGSSKRFGSCKQLAPYREKPLIAWAGRAAQESCAASVTLLAATGSDVIAAARRFCPFIIVNERAEDGMGTSIALATQTLSRVSDALIFTLADQPLVTSEHLNHLISAWDRAENSIVATAQSDTIGPPVLFGRGAFNALCQLSGDAGAKDLLRDPSFDVTSVRFEPASLDVDTTSDLEELP